MKKIFVLKAKTTMTDASIKEAYESFTAQLMMYGFLLLDDRFECVFGEVDKITRECDLNE